MFDGNEQFHQYIASSRTSLPISLPFPLHGNPSFDTYAPPPPPPPSIHRSAAKNIDDSKKYPQISTNLALERERSTDPWSNDELLALLKVRSSMELWFPDFNWEHVSRKLGELGFKRSGDQCKDKFEEESRHFNNNKNYRILSELDEFYQPPPVSAQEEVDQQKLVVVVPQMKKVGEMIPENPSSQEMEMEMEMATKKSSKKRKRKDKLEMLKGFCEAVVRKMMVKQEELHNKLIQDIIKMDQAKIAREEAWKNQEMDRIKTEIETRTKDHKSAAERQATIIQFLKHFTSDQDQQIVFKNKYCSTSNSNSCASFPQTQNNEHDDVATPPPPPPPTMIYQNPPPPSSPSNAAKDSTLSDYPPPPQCLSEGGGGDDIGKRWPRDEVVALINLRCKMSSGGGGGGGDQESSSGGGSKEGGVRGPLWERISVGMSELGYKRSAKRCKEKWENINKYFRKTKDSSKKRSLNSRTCPYFHHLTSLYSDGTIVAPTVNAAAAAPET